MKTIEEALKTIVSENIEEDVRDNMSRNMEALLAAKRAMKDAYSRCEFSDVRDVQN